MEIKSRKQVMIFDICLSSLFCKLKTEPDLLLTIPHLFSSLYNVTARQEQFILRHISAGSGFIFNLACHTLRHIFYFSNLADHLAVIESR